VQQRKPLNATGASNCSDRTGLILEIFAGPRPPPAKGVLQVELAALSYQRTRLVACLDAASNASAGGFGLSVGQARRRIESDRRAIDYQRSACAASWKKGRRTRELHRARAARCRPGGGPVGYTNSGKSTLFKPLTGADVLRKTCFSATAAIRRCARWPLPTGTQDQSCRHVGFISDLPDTAVALSAPRSKKCWRPI